MDNAKKIDNIDTYRFYNERIDKVDPEVFETIVNEAKRQDEHIELIASENMTSQAVLDALGSVFTDKYAEGYPGRRYYGGCVNADQSEQLAIDRAKELFDCEFVNVQPHSGASANESVFLALLQPGDTILGMSLACGGHLTHGAAPSMSGKWFNAIQYGVREDDALIDYEEVEALAREHKPKMIIAGASAYPRVIDWARFRKIADEVGAYLMTDIAHYAGLVAGGAYPSPLPHAHVVTTTTHKTLRGPSGGMIMSNDPAIGKKINSAVFPGFQGKPLSHAVAAKAVAFGQALKPEFKDYAQKIIDNAKVLAEEVKKGGLDIVSGGTDSHIVLIDLRPKGLTGNIAEVAMENAGLTCNKNAVPYDPEKPMVTSGVRVGSPVGTTRGFGEDEFRLVGQLIVKVLDGLKANGPDGNAAVEQEVLQEVKDLCKRFPAFREAKY